MAELVLVKLGGSLITDKTQVGVARLEVIDRLAAEIAMALSERPDLSLILGHGSGSFGHTVAHRYGLRQGNPADWRGYAETATAAQRLNRIVIEALLRAGVSAVSIQPSASAVCCKGQLIELNLEPIRHLLAHGLVPLVYGDVSIDRQQGCTIVSTEQVLSYLARALQPSRLLVVGEVDGVYTSDPRQDPAARLLSKITPGDLHSLSNGLAGSHGVDVTGGMRAKVELLADLVQDVPGLQTRIIGGRQPGVLAAALIDPTQEPGTLIAPS